MFCLRVSHCQRGLYIHAYRQRFIVRESVRFPKVVAMVPWTCHKRYQCFTSVPKATAREVVEIALIQFLVSLAGISYVAPDMLFVYIWQFKYRKCRRKQCTVDVQGVSLRSNYDNLYCRLLCPHEVACTTHLQSAM